MKRMIDNKEFNELKKDVKDVEAHTSDYIINQVVYDSEAEKVTGFVIKDVENSITYNVELDGGGKQLYTHNLEVKGLNMEIVNDVSTAYTSGGLRNYIKDLGLNASNKLKKCDGILSYNEHKYLIKGVFCSGTLYTFVGWDLADYTAVYNLAFATDNVVVNDTVTSI